VERDGSIRLASHSQEETPIRVIIAHIGTTIGIGSPLIIFPKIFEREFGKVGLAETKLKLGFYISKFIETN
jgi:hypothetical protein